MSRMKVKDAYCLHIRYTRRLKNAGYQLCVLTDKADRKSIWQQIFKTQ